MANHKNVISTQLAYFARKSFKLEMTNQDRSFAWSIVLTDFRNAYRIFNN